MTTPQASAPEVGQSYQHDGPRQLRRSRSNHVIAGVCGGLGHYFGVDPVFLRIAFVAMTLAGGSGVLLYIIAWIAIPESGADDDPATTAAQSFSAPQAVIGAGLVLLGVFLLADQLLPQLAGFFWPVLLMAIGAIVLIRGDER